MSYPNDSSGYDRDLLARAPTVSKAEKQEGYDLKLLQNPTPPRSPSPSRQHLPPTTPLQAETLPPPAVYSEKAGRSRSFWKRPTGKITLAVILLVIIGAVVGGAVGGTSGKKHGSSTPAVSPPVSGSSTASTDTTASVTNTGGLPGTSASAGTTAATATTGTGKGNPSATSHSDAPGGATSAASATTSSNANLPGASTTAAPPPTGEAIDITFGEVNTVYAA